MNPAHLPDIDSLMDAAADECDGQPPGVQAQVDQTAADIAAYFGSQGEPLTVDSLRHYFAGVILTAIAAGVDPDRPVAAASLGWELAGAALLRRQLERRGGPS